MSEEIFLVAVGSGTKVHLAASSGSPFCGAGACRGGWSRRRLSIPYTRENLATFPLDLRCQTCFTGTVTKEA